MSVEQTREQLLDELVRMTRARDLLAETADRLIGERDEARQQLEGAVDLLREAAPLVTNPYAPRDAVAAWITRYREIVEPSTDSGGR